MGIPEGFGQRLKAERKRLKLSQTEMAEIGKVGRLTQLQYESEQNAPTTRYLSLVSTAGVDLGFLMLGLRPEARNLTPEQQDRVEGKAFEWVEIYAETQPDGRLGPDARRHMYQVFRTFWIQKELGELPANLTPEMFMSFQKANEGK